MGPGGAGPRTQFLQFRREVEAVKFVVHELSDVPREIVVPVGEKGSGVISIAGKEELGNGQEEYYCS